MPACGICGLYLWLRALLCHGYVMEADGIDGQVRQEAGIDERDESGVR